MEIKTYKVFKFDELTEVQKEKVIQRYENINVDCGWWKHIYEDAKTIGLEISGFDLYRRDIEGDLLLSVKEVIEKIKENHGKKCDTYKTALRYQKEALRLFNLQDFTDMDYDVQENLNQNFKIDILKDYLVMLKRDYDYLTTKEAIIETIEANDYTFTEDGKID
jgi:hypothetical protein